LEQRCLRGQTATMSGKIVRKPSGVSRTTASAKIASGRTESARTANGKLARGRTESASAKSGTETPPNANER
jgi:hypothetical protein